MFPKRYDPEQLAFEQHYQLLLDLEKQRLHRERRQQQPTGVQYLAAKLGVLLVRVRKSLKMLE